MKVVAKNARVRAYLCGPINGRSDSDCKDWRAWADERLLCTTINPMDRDYRGRETELGIITTIVEGDKEDVASADFILVYFDQPSIGTAMECLFAWQLGKSVIVTNVSGKVLSPWLAYHSHAVYTDLGVAVEHINQEVLRQSFGD